MMRLQRFFAIILIGIGGLFLIAACSLASPEAPNPSAVEATSQEGGEHGMMGDEHGMAGMAHMHAEVPEEYANLTNPLAGDAEATKAGKVIFEASCATCHGPEGHGDGPAAAELEPKPANLADAAMMGELNDAYLFWRVSEGGAIAPFNSAMPPWKETLSETERWQVVNYLRTFATGEHHMAGEHHKMGEN